MILRTLICLLTLLGLACVDDSKIDRTNATMEANLEELKLLNKNFIAASKNVENLQAPVNAISDQFGKLIDIFAATQSNFARFIEVGTMASQQALALMSVIPAEKIREYGDNLDDLVLQIAAFNLTLTEQSGAIAPLIGQLASSGGMLVKLVQLMEKVDSTQISRIETSVGELAESAVWIKETLQGQLATVLPKISELLSDPKFMENANGLPELASALTLLNIHLDEMAPFLNCLNGLPLDKVTLDEEFVKQLKSVITSLEKIAAGMDKIPKIPNVTDGVKKIWKKVWPWSSDEEE